MTRSDGGLQETVQLLNIAVGWARLTCSVALIVEVGPYYAQLLFNHDVVYGEFISNAYLRGADQLTARQEFRLTDLGWQVPEVPCHPDCARRHPNFHRLWTRRISTDVIVRDILSTLISVYMRGEGDRLSLISVQRMTAISTTQPANH